MTHATERGNPKGHSKDIIIIDVYDITGFPPEIKATVEWRADARPKIEWHASEMLSRVQRNAKLRKKLERAVEDAAENFAEGCYEKHKHRVAKCYFSFNDKAK